MEDFFAINFGTSSQVFSYIILPLLIFLARIADVSINTLRIIFVMSGKKLISTILGFFESAIWLLAIGEIFKNMDNVMSYVAYPLGFAMGILVGMMIEERLALGKVVVRVISAKPFDHVVEFINAKNLRYFLVHGDQSGSHETILFTVLKRDELQGFISVIREHMPTSFYTVESVKQAGEIGILAEKPSRRGIGTWLGSIKRR